jgi:hypothetical protein
MSEEPEAPPVVGQGSEPPRPHPVGDPRRNEDGTASDDVNSRMATPISRVRSEDLPAEPGQPTTDPTPGWAS